MTKITADINGTIVEIEVEDNFAQAYAEIEEETRREEERVAKRKKRHEGELWEAMKANGYEDLFTINSQTLSATVKELMANNDGVLPEFLVGLIKIAEKHTIRMAKKKAY